MYRTGQGSDSWFDFNYTGKYPKGFDLVEACWIRLWSVYIDRYSTKWKVTNSSPCKSIFLGRVFTDVALTLGLWSSLSTFLAKKMQ